VLFLMSYSSIIHESDDPRRDFRRRLQRARRVGLDAAFMGRDADDRQGVIQPSATTIHARDLIPHTPPPPPPRKKPPVPRRHAFAGRRDQSCHLPRRSISSVLWVVGAFWLDMAARSRPRRRPRGQLSEGTAPAASSSPKRAFRHTPLEALLAEHATADVQSPAVTRGDEAVASWAKTLYLSFLRR